MEGMMGLKDSALIMIGVQAICFGFLALFCFAAWSFPDWFFVRVTIVIGVLLGLGFCAHIEESNQ